jgi:hypothetical protein
MSATFSGGKFTDVKGAVAPFGIPLGSRTGSSSILRNALNGLKPVVSLGNSLLKAANNISQRITCNTLFGGQ